MQHQITFAQDRNEKSLRLLRLFKNYSFIDTKQKKLKTKFLMKSSVKWAVDSHHDSKVRRRNIMLAWKRWDKQEKSKIKIQESEDSYEDHYEI